MEAGHRNDAGGAERYMQAYKALLEAQDAYLECAKKTDLDPGYLKTLFGRCCAAFEKEDREGMKRGAEESWALGKIEDGAIAAPITPELDAIGTRIVQCASILCDTAA